MNIDQGGVNTKSKCFEQNICQEIVASVPDTNTNVDDDKTKCDTSFSYNNCVQTPRAPGLSCQALKHAVCALNRLDDFTMEKIGAGFFSEVFKVTHKVNLKVMVLKMNLSRTNRPNMLKEVQLMNQLNHPNILKFQGVCVHEGQLHALTEYINGGSLEQLIQNVNIELTYLIRQQLSLDIALGMEYLHGKGVFHRDLTSKNVLVKKLDNNKLQAVVGDFGLAAKIPDPKNKYRLPTVGSFYWMSPECLKGELYNEKSDIFSYGIVLCEMIARIEADPDVLPRTDNFGLDYLYFTELCGPCPASFLKLTFSCCNYDPNCRPSFTEIVNSLKNLLMHYKSSDNISITTLGCSSNLATKSSITARSEELINIVPSREVNVRQVKVQHRRSLSEDLSFTLYPSHITPSDKARCHILHPSKHRDDNTNIDELLDPKHVGESMAKVDPYYKPRQSNEKGNRSNPFLSLSQFRGVKKILGSHVPVVVGAGSTTITTTPTTSSSSTTVTSDRSCLSPTQFLHNNDLFSSCFELPSPFYGATPPSSPIRTTTTSTPPQQPCCGCFVKNNNCLPATCVTSPENICCYHRGVDCCYIDRHPSKLPKKLTRSKSVPYLTQPASSLIIKKNVIITKDTKKQLIQYLRYKNRVYASSNNILECGSVSDCNMTQLRRRGSCESGFFSCLGEDISGTEWVASSDYVLHCARNRPADASSTTLSSSPVSSLLLLDDSSHSTTTVSSLRSGSGDFNDIDDLPSRLHNHAAYLISTGKRTSSIYTDSSEDVSSLGENMDDRGRSQQITKIVEYFERKHKCNSVVVGQDEACRRRTGDVIQWEGMEGKFKKSGMSLSQNNKLTPNRDDHCLSEAIRKSKIQLLRKSLERGTLYIPGVNPLYPRRSLANRLMVCEGAVKSKLPLFDKKN